MYVFKEIILTESISNIQHNFDRFRIFSGRETFSKYWDNICLNPFLSHQIQTNTLYSTIDDSPLAPLFIWGDDEELYREVANEYIKMILSYSLDISVRENRTNPYLIAKMLEVKYKPFVNTFVNPFQRLCTITPSSFYESFYRIKNHVQMGNKAYLTCTDTIYLEILKTRICAEIYQGMGLEW